MNTYEITCALQNLGIRLRANEDRTRVVVSKREKRLITPELGREIKRNQADLLCEIILHEANKQIYDYITEMHAQPFGSPAYRAAVDAFHDDGRHERLNEAWSSEDLESFKATIAEAIAAAEAALHHAMDREERAREERRAQQERPEAAPGEQPDPDPVAQAALALGA